MRTNAKPNIKSFEFFLSFASLFILVGALTLKSDYTHRTTGKIVQKKNCDEEDKQCKLNVEYTVNGETYSINGVYFREEIKSDEISVYYNPKDPSNSTILQPAGKVFRVILILIGVIIALFTLSDLFFAFTSDEAAMGLAWSKMFGRRSRI